MLGLAFLDPKAAMDQLIDTVGGGSAFSKTLHTLNHASPPLPPLPVPVLAANGHPASSGAQTSGAQACGPQHHCEEPGSRDVDHGRNRGYARPDDYPRHHDFFAHDQLPHHYAAAHHYERPHHETHSRPSSEYRPNDITLRGGDNTVDTGRCDDHVTVLGGNNTINTHRGDDHVTLKGGNNTVNTGRGDDHVAVNGGNNTVNTGWGDDHIAVEGGNNTIDGGQGYDTAIFKGARSDYTVSHAHGATIVVNKKTGERSTLANVEKLKFTDAGVKPGDCNGDWSVSNVANGKATIHLGDRYTIDLNENDGNWTLTDNQSGAKTRIWGDPHVDMGANGSTEFDFKKSGTFQLADGTKITVSPVDSGNGTTMSSKLTITNGDKAMTVTGLADRHDGANNLSVSMGSNGRALDRATPDGAFTLHESGDIWTLNGRPVDQAGIDAAERC